MRPRSWRRLAISSENFPFALPGTEPNVPKLEGLDLPEFIQENAVKFGRNDGTFTVEDEREYLKLLEELDKRQEFSGIWKWFLPNGPFSIDNCPKHKLFFKAGRIYHQRAFMAGNRVGKSVAGAFESACHLLGEYPDWWEGKVFTEPTNGWACGQTGQTTRDTVQKELMGDLGRIGTGMIPKDKIVKVHSRAGIPFGIDTVEVRHSSGGISNVSFKSYDQDIKAFYGTARHWVWLDEECPELIYNECLIRTMTTRGIIYVTFTPLHSVTPFIVNFDKDADHLGGARHITVEVDGD